MALKAAQFAADLVAPALRDAYTKTADQVAKLLKDAQYDAHQVAIGLRLGLNQGAADLAAAMKFAQFGATAVITEVMSRVRPPGRCGCAGHRQCGVRAERCRDRHPRGERRELPAPWR